MPHCKLQYFLLYFRNKNKEIEDLKNINEELKCISARNKDLELRTQNLEISKLSKELRQEKVDFDKLKNQNDCLRLSLEVLHRRMESIENENKYLTIRLRMKEDEVDDYVAYNKPLEKAYKSLQRRYGLMLDKLEDKNITKKI